MSGEGKVVLVSGGSGYIASWLIKVLLQRAYTVRATVRNPNDVKKNAHLLELDGAKGRLTLVKADLLEEGSFDAAVDGCDGVFHTASPVTFAITDPQRDMIDPAVKGTLNVLKSCAKAASVKRVILTSSFAAFPYNGKPLDPDVVVDETWFSDPGYCKQHQRWYEMAKALAEQAAWKFAEENSINLITLHPVFVIGPILQSTPNMSVEVILNLVNGADEYPDSYYCSVDVRDVAVAHLQAFEIPSASGRYCLIESDPHFSDILKILHQHYPNLQLPQKCGAAGKHFKTKYKVSAERTRDLGIDYIPLEASLKDTVESLKEKGFLTTLV